MNDPSDLTITQATEELGAFLEQIESWVERGPLLNAYALPEVGGIRIPSADVEALKRSGHAGEQESSMKSNAIADPIHEVEQFHQLVHRQHDTTQAIREKLRHSGNAAFKDLGSETQELLAEITSLVSNAPIELRTGLGDQAFSHMHRDVAAAVAASTSTPDGLVGADWRRERLSTSIDIAVYILDLLSEGARTGLSGSEAERAKALYIANVGTTRL
jgi:hypothetical protein